MFAVAYLTPPDSHTVRAHSDSQVRSDRGCIRNLERIRDLRKPSLATQTTLGFSQDVFLLQLWGSKEWNLYCSPVPLCLSTEMLGKTKPIDFVS